MIQCAFKSPKTVMAEKFLYTSPSGPTTMPCRLIEKEERKTRKNEKQINHQNKPKSQNKLKKNNALQWPLGVFTRANSNSVSEIIRIFFDNAIIASNYSLMKDKVT